MSGYTRNCGRWSCFSHQIPFNFNLETYLPSLPSLCPVDQISSFFIIIIKCLLSNPTEVAAVVTGVHDMRYLLPWYNTNREQFDAMKFLDRFNITFTFIIKFKFSSLISMTFKNLSQTFTKRNEWILWLILEKYL